MKTNSMIQNDTVLPPSSEDISQRARELWEKYGRPSGRDEEIWLEAERQLLGVDPLVEGKGDIAVAARQFDQSTAQSKPRTRSDKTSAPKTPATSARTKR